MLARLTRRGIAILVLCLALGAAPYEFHAPVRAATSSCAGRHDVSFATQADPSSQAMVTAIACATSQIRGLTARTPILVHLLDPTLLRSSVIQIMQQDVASQPISGTTVALQLLGALGPKEDLAAVRGTQYTTNTAAQYDPRTGTLYVRTSAGRYSPLDRAVIAHEYTRALQDQLVGLGLLLSDSGDGPWHDSDALLARQALVEGDAFTTMLNYAAVAFSKADKLTLTQELQQGGDNPVADYAHDQVGFPLTQGPPFVRAIRDAAARGVHGDAAQQAAGNDAVNRAFHDPPTSTGEVLNPALYLRRVGKNAPPVPAPEIAMGADWTETDSDVLGPYGISDLLGQRLQHTGNQQAADLATKQWQGDRWVVYQRAADAILVWRGQFATAAGAQAFVRALSAYTAARFHATLATRAPVNWYTANYAIAARQRDTGVVVAIGSSKGLFDLVKRACGVLGYP